MVAEAARAAARKHRDGADERRASAARPGQSYDARRGQLSAKRSRCSARLLGDEPPRSREYDEQPRIPVSTTRGACPRRSRCCATRIALARTALGERPSGRRRHRDQSRLLAHAGRASTHEALTLLDRALEIRNAAFGDNSSASREHAEHQGEPAARDARTIAAARDAAHQARVRFSPRIFRLITGASATAASAEGAALTALGDYAEAEPLLVRSKEVLSQGGAAMELLSRQSSERLDAPLFGVAQTITNVIRPQGRYQYLCLFVRSRCSWSPPSSRSAAGAQEPVRQLLKDAWVATSQKLTHRRLRCRAERARAEERRRRAAQLQSARVREPDARHAGRGGARPHRRRRHGDLALRKRQHAIVPP